MSRLARVVAVAVVAATPVLSVVASPAAPATAATCAAGGGVSVVVDFNGIGGGGLVTGCIADGGGDAAADLFETAGHELTRAQRQPGFVCRVDAVPAEDPCVNTSPASAYWGLWWSDGKSGEWTYSSLGVDSLKVPAGGSVAFAWDDVEGTEQPSVAPPRTAPSASPSSPATGSGGSGSGGAASGGSGSGGSGGGTSASTGGAAPSAGAGSTASASSGPSAEGGRSDEDTRRERRERRGGSTTDVTSSPVPTDSVTASTSASPEAETTAEPTAAPTDDAGLPVWVAPLAVLALAVGAGVAVLLRRRSTP